MRSVASPDDAARTRKTRTARSKKRAELRSQSLSEISRACERAITKASLKRRKRLRRRRIAHLQQSPPGTSAHVPPPEDFAIMKEEDYANDHEALRIFLSDPIHHDLKGVGYLVRKHITVTKSTYLVCKFSIPNELFENIREHNYIVHFGSLLCDDAIQNRLHWPHESVCDVNRVPVPVAHRKAKHQLGIHGRDKPVDISKHIKAGDNEVYLECDGENGRRFMLYVRVCKKRSRKEVVDDILVNKPVDVRPANRHDPNDGLVILDDTIRLSLKCQVSLKPIQLPARCTSCNCQNVFDLEPFLDMTEKSLKWSCPFCLRETSISDIVVDRRVQRILHETDHRGDILVRTESENWTDWSVVTDE